MDYKVYLINPLDGSLLLAGFRTRVDADAYIVEKRRKESASNTLVIVCGELLVLEKGML